MRVLATNEIWEWCRNQGIVLSSDGHLQESDRLSHRDRIVVSPRGRTGNEREAGERCAKALGRWRECLVWIVGWGAWPNGEDWPAFYGIREAIGERRSVEEAPGHVLTRDEDDMLVELITLLFENGWDAHVLPLSNNGQPARRLRISHDGWAEIHASVPISID
ncbi:MAG: hypothetical protein ACQGVC_04240 [Myxococcota bacterium]